MTSISEEFAQKRMNENGYKESLLLSGDVFKTIEIAKLEGKIEYIEEQIEGLGELLNSTSFAEKIITGALIRAFKKDKEKYELKLKNILIKNNQ